MEPQVDPDSPPLSDFAKDVHSQCGEDGIIAEILRRLPTRDRWCVEFGAWDGFSYSNTAALWEAGYYRVLIEGDARRFAALERRLGRSPRTHLIKAMVGWTAPDSLDLLLKETPVPTDFDLLSIDIDGNDYHVWSAVEEYRPKLVVIEFNPTIRNGVRFVQEPDSGLHQSSSIDSLVDLADQKGYELAATTEFNAFFVSRELFEILGISDNSVGHLRRDKSWQSEVFFGFDGRAIIMGGRGLEWHGLPMPHDKRFVPKFFEGFPAADFGLPRKALLKLWAAWRRRATRRTTR